MVKDTPIVTTVGGIEKRIAKTIVTPLGIKPYMFKASSVPITRRAAAQLQIIHVRHRGQSTGFGIRSMQHFQRHSHVSAFEGILPG